MIEIDMGKKAKQPIIRKWSMILRVNVVLNIGLLLTVVDNLSVCVGHLKSQSELYQVNSWYQTLGIDTLGIGRLLVKP